MSGIADTGTSETMDSTAETIWETAGAVMVGRPPVGLFRISDTTESTTETIVGAGASVTREAT